MTDKQKAIIKTALENGGQVTKKQVVENFGHWYYANSSFHIGNLLSRMVKTELLVRIKPGVFNLGKGTKQKPATILENQITLF